MSLKFSQNSNVIFNFLIASKLFTGDENDLKEDCCTEDNFGSLSHVYQSRNSDVNDDDQFESFIPDDDNSLDSGIYFSVFSYFRKS